MKRKITFGIMGGAGVLVFAFLFWWFLSPNADPWLKKFTDLTKTDPLLYLPLVSPSQFASSVKLLETVEEKLLTFHTEKDIRLLALSPEEKDSLRLWPIHFLEALVESDRASEEFLSRPTRFAAWRFLRRQEKVGEAYLEDVSAIKASYERVSWSTRQQLWSRYFQDLENANFVTSEIILKDFDLFLQNGKVLRAEVKSRKNCLFFGRCPEPRKFQPEEGEFVIDERPFLPTKLLFPEYRTTLKETAGPYRVPSRCFRDLVEGTEMLSPFFLVQEKLHPQFPAFLSAKLATENYYVDLHSATTPSPAIRLFLEKGIGYFPLRASAPRRCADLGYLPKLATLEFIDTMVRKEDGTFLGAGISTPSAKRAAEAEAALLESRAPSIADLTILGKAYREALEDPETVRGLADRREKVMQAFLGIFTQTPRLPELFNMISLSDFLFWEGEEAAGGLGDLETLFATQNHASLLFLPFSPTAWRIGETPRYHISQSQWQKEVARIIDERGLTPSQEEFLKESLRAASQQVIGYVRKYSELKKEIPDAVLWEEERRAFELGLADVSRAASKLNLP